MSQQRSDSVGWLIIALAGLATAVVAQFGLAVFGRILPVVVAVAAIWGLASAAMARLMKRSVGLSAPALAVFVVDIVAVVAAFSSHRAYLGIAMVNATAGFWILWTAVRFDQRSRG